MWINIVQPDRSEVKSWHMLFACCITKATNIHSEYVIPIDFPLQQWLRPRASILRCRILCYQNGVNEN